MELQKFPKPVLSLTREFIADRVQAQVTLTSSVGGVHRTVQMDYDPTMSADEMLDLIGRMVNGMSDMLQRSEIEAWLAHAKEIAESLHDDNRV